MNNEKLVCIVQEWVLSSLEAENWVDEEPYEMVDFSPAVRNLRYNFTYIIYISYMYIYSKIFINCINLHLQSNKHLNLFQFILIVWYFHYFETYVYMNRFLQVLIYSLSLST